MALTHFQERSTQDAAAVKILTVITLIYLPMTVVAVCSSFLDLLTSKLITSEHILQPIDTGK
jgi:hypothetical protein